MKKSDIYRACQQLVLHAGDLYPDHIKLEFLRELMTQEDLAKFAEEQEAKKNEAV